MRYQTGIILDALFDPKPLFIFADLRFLNLYILTLIQFFTRKPIFLHGQGLYKYDRCLFFHKVAFKFFGYFNAIYIAYNEFVLKDLLRKVDFDKIHAVNNRLEIEPVKYKRFSERKILIMGRSRNGSLIKEFLDFYSTVDSKINFVVISDIPPGSIHDERVTVNFSVFDEAKIREISADCCAGLYIGDCGLSVVHYMSLGLPVIIHDSIRNHMGPEPAYVKPSFGKFFKRGDFNSILEVLLLVTNLRLEDLTCMSDAALKEFESLTKKSYAVELHQIFELYC
jgi:glycosyltransferase involved in cell wall biosynthesis